MPVFGVTARTVPCSRVAALAGTRASSMIEITSSIIHGVKPARMTADQRAGSLIRRAWTATERRVVVRGFAGRLSIAIEPLLCGVVFAAITAGVFAAPRLSPRWVNPDIVIVAPVFALGVLACIAWLVGVMLAPTRALAHTLRPIYIVDGYIRFRPPDESSLRGTNGYIAVLTDAGTVACEWPTLGDVGLPHHTRAAVCEFSEYGGVHAVDGRRTGVLPERFPALGVGVHGRKEEIA